MALFSYMFDLVIVRNKHTHTRVFVFIPIFYLYNITYVMEVNRNFKLIIDYKKLTL